LTLQGTENHRRFPWANTQTPARILAYDHIGIRVSDKPPAMHFYSALGLSKTGELSLIRGQRDDSFGRSANQPFIFNAHALPMAHNARWSNDQAARHEPIRHLLYDDLEALVAWLNERGNHHQPEGPASTSAKRIACLSAIRTATFLNSTNWFNEVSNETL